MLRTRQTEVSGKHPLAAYFGGVTHRFKNMRNVTNFYIRNTMTGILKSPEDRTHNETEVLHFVFTGLHEANRLAAERLNRKIAKARTAGGMKGTCLMKAALDGTAFFRYPDIHHRFLSYNQLDAIFKCTKNADYYSLPAQVNQQAIKRTLKDWASCFGKLKARRENPAAFQNPIHFPGYIRSDRATTHFTNQVCKPSLAGGQLMLTFPGSGLDFFCGEGILPGQVEKVEVCVYHSGYRLLVTCEDGMKEPAIPENPGRLLGLDPGVTNFLTGVFSFPHAPFLVKGKWLKALNQWYNKEKARLVSELTRGGDKYRETPRLEALSRGRDRKFRDFFYKLAHYICRLCQKEGVEVIVCGHNTFQKQGVNMGASNNQTFVSIPYTSFYQILRTVAWQYGLPVIFREESYTSKASFLDNDPIPTCRGTDTKVQDTGDGADRAAGSADAKPKPATEEECHFSGSRVKRGLYRSGNGTLLNADVNGAANILRKEYPDAFAGITDFSFLWKSVDVITRKDIVCKAYKEKTGHSVRRKPARSQGRAARHHRRWASRILYMEVFGVTKMQKADYAKEAMDARMGGKAA